MFSIDADIRSPGHGGRRALIVDVGYERRESLTCHLIRRGFHVSHAADAMDALSIIGAEAPNLALLRSEQDGDEGERTAALAAMLYPYTRIIVIAGEGSSLGLRRDEGAFPILRHPMDLDRCLDALTA